MIKQDKKGLAGRYCFGSAPPDPPASPHKKNRKGLASLYRLNVLLPSPFSKPRFFPAAQPYVAMFGEEEGSRYYALDMTLIEAQEQHKRAQLKARLRARRGISVTVS